MCGIGGILRVTTAGERHEPIPESWLDALDERIAWRGPDGAGRFRDVVKGPDGSTFEVALVHRRLSIIDHEGGGQPFVLKLRGHSPDQCRACGVLSGADELSEGADRTIAVFNGCIYNHRTLRAELVERGHRFISDHSDTEVLLHAWREWGPSFIEKLDGMFAFALWDRARAAVFLARDRFGEKPLYICEALDDRTVLWGSTVGAVHSAHRFVSDRADELQGDLLRLWIPSGYSHSQTVAPLIEGLRPGQCRMLGGHAPADPDADLPSAAWDTGVRSWDGRDLDVLDELLSEAVRTRLEADVPLGCFLSGGIDSSIVTLYAHRHRSDVPAFTVRMPDESFDESHWAEQAAKAIGCEHELIECNGAGAAADLCELIDRLGQPFGDSSLLPTYWLCRAARTRVKVALSGDGGDELFGGYRRYRAIKPLRWCRPLLRLLPERWLDRSDPRGRGEQLARMIDAARGASYPDLGLLFPTRDARRLVDRATVPTNPWLTSSDARWARRLDAATYLPWDLMLKVDTASMAAGLESRAPFLEPMLVSAAFSVPVSLHMQNGESKHLLKQLARRHFPAELIDRPKQGFAIPISEWWRTDFGGLGTLLLELLDRPEPFGAVHEVLPINMGFVRQMIDEHWTAGGLPARYSTGHVRKRDHGQRLFGLVTLALWARDLPRRHGDTERGRVAGQSSEF